MYKRASKACWNLRRTKKKKDDVTVVIKIFGIKKKMSKRIAGNLLHLPAFHVGISERRAVFSRKGADMELANVSK